jgi:peptidyl-dipeptidase A
MSSREFFMKPLFFLLVLTFSLAGCDAYVTTEAGFATTPPEESADEFVARINAELDELGTEVAAANWVRSTYLTEETAILASAAAEKYLAWHGRAVADSRQYEGQELSPETARALKLLKLSTAEPAPDDAAKRKELATIKTDLAGMYGSGEYCPDDGRECMTLTDLTTIMAESRDFEELLDAWMGWRKVAVPMRDKYQRFAELTNEGASELGYEDLGEMWRASYDMTPAEFDAESLRLWQQVKPLYDELHCHVRATLAEHYGEDKVPTDQPIPAHLLGNMWSHSWDPLYDLLEPYPGVASLDVDKAIREQDYSPVEMVESAEEFYVSLGMPELPDTFWERSLLSQPADRDVICHASAWQIGWDNDVRIKMCIQQTYEELRVIYHELGHNYYYTANQDQPPLFQGGANAGFHEGIGDTITLSMTPRYLQEVGLIDSAEISYEATINRQMQQALAKVAFLPFGKLIDEWRWGVFSGKITPENYNKAWWDLRTRYQGIAAPVERSEDDFDPGAKYHVPANVSYTRYFIAHILQFQFQRALCKAAGHEGPLNECSIYGSKAAGDRLMAMLEVGASEPWQDTLEKLTGTREMDATAIIDYFQPLMTWLQEQNRDRRCGW